MDSQTFLVNDSGVRNLEETCDKEALYFHSSDEKCDALENITETLPSAESATTTMEDSDAQQTHDEVSFAEEKLPIVEHPTFQSKEEGEDDDDDCDEIDIFSKEESIGMLTEEGIESLLAHSEFCLVTVNGGCTACEALWEKLWEHARSCRKVDCFFPKCKVLRPDRPSTIRRSISHTLSPFLVLREATSDSAASASSSPLARSSISARARRLSSTLHSLVVTTPLKLPTSLMSKQ